MSRNLVEMLVSDVSYGSRCNIQLCRIVDITNLPMDLTGVLKKPNGNTVHWSITPSLVKETTRAVQMVEVILVHLTSPKVHIGDLKIRPEVTG